MIDADYFARKRAELGLDRADALSRFQATLDKWYGPGLVRVRKIHHGVVRIVTPNASLAGELRLRQREFLACHQADVDEQAITRLQISVGVLR